MTATCRSCGAPIIWTHTPAGRRMPIDADPTESGNLHLQEHPAPYVVLVDSAPCPCPRSHYVSHFATCPQAGTWRK